MLREVVASDLPLLFEQQRDPASHRMAAVTPRERDAFMEHWRTILANPTGFVRTIVFKGDVAGHVVSWESDGKNVVGYWVGREHWGKGIATRAVAELLRLVTKRPLHAHVAKANVASLRVLEKCGFEIVSESKVPFGAPGEEIDDVLLALDTPA